MQKLSLHGRHFFIGKEKVFLKGVRFRANNIPSTDRSDLSNLSDRGFNLLHLSSTTPLWFLDIAAEYGFWVLIDFDFRLERGSFMSAKKIYENRTRMAAAAKPFAEHVAVLGFSISSFISPTVVRWLGEKKVCALLEQLLRAVKDAAPEKYVTCALIQSPEHSHLVGFKNADFLCCELSVSDVHELKSALGRVLETEFAKPLLITGNTRADLQPEFALEILRRGPAGMIGFEIGASVVDKKQYWLASYPKISVVLTVFNQAPQLEACLSALSEQIYPNFEVLVVDDGSTDHPAEVVNRLSRKLGVKFLAKTHEGIVVAKNVGAQATSARVVAFTDVDCQPTPEWLFQIAFSFESGVDAVQGTVDNAFALSWQEVATKVVSRRSDKRADKNFAVIRETFLRVGCFDSNLAPTPAAIDLGWRIQKHGGRVGTAYAAAVTEQTALTFKSFSRRQIECGRNSAILHSKCPEYFNRDLERADRPHWSLSKDWYATAFVLFASRGVFPALWLAGALMFCVSLVQSLIVAFNLRTSGPAKYYAAEFYRTLLIFVAPAYWEMGWLQAKFKQKRNYSSFKSSRINWFNSKTFKIELTYFPDRQRFIQKFSEQLKIAGWNVYHPHGVDLATTAGTLWRVDLLTLVDAKTARTFTLHGRFELRLTPLGKLVTSLLLLLSALVGYSFNQIFTGDLIYTTACGAALLACAAYYRCRVARIAEQISLPPMVRDAPAARTLSPRMLAPQKFDEELESHPT